MGKSKIEWTDRVWNPVTGCTKISPGCDNCYAYSMSKRFCKEWGLSDDDPFKVTLHPDRFKQPINWNKPSKIFVCSMADLFHDDVTTGFISDVFRVMEQAKQHTFIVLTKRPERMRQLLNGVVTGHDIAHRKHIWLGVTAENQEQADKRIPILLQTPAAVRFVSVEPMLGPVDINQYLPHNPRLFSERNGHKSFLDWVICGGESGPGARPMHPDWARSLRDQCQIVGVPYFFKQFGEYYPSIVNNSTEPLVTGLNCVGVRGNKAVTMADGLVMERIGKKAAGSLLDGQEWKQFPGVGA